MGHSISSGLWVQSLTPQCVCVSFLLGTVEPLVVRYCEDEASAFA